MPRAGNFTNLKEATQQPDKQLPAKAALYLFCPSSAFVPRELVEARKRQAAAKEARTAEKAAGSEFFSRGGSDKPHAGVHSSSASPRG